MRRADDWLNDDRLLPVPRHARAQARAARGGQGHERGATPNARAESGRGATTRARPVPRVRSTPNHHTTHTKSTATPAAHPCGFVCMHEIAAKRTPQSTIHSTPGRNPHRLGVTTLRWVPVTDPGFPLTNVPRSPRSPAQSNRTPHRASRIARARCTPRPPQGLRYLNHPRLATSPTDRNNRARMRNQTAHCKRHTRAPARARCTPNLYRGLRGLNHHRLHKGVKQAWVGRDTLPRGIEQPRWQPTPAIPGTTRILLAAWSHREQQYSTSIWSGRPPTKAVVDPLNCGITRPESGRVRNPSMLLTSTGQDPALKHRHLKKR